MSVETAIRLGRVSNLPTVWSNALAGTVLAGGEPWRLSTLLAAAGLSLLYVAGMYLNDAFDREIDARERPSRPIPAGLVSTDAVFAAGFGLMLGGLAFIATAGAAAGSPTTLPLTLAALALAGAIVFYDWHHKGNVLSPFFMGLCRVLAYVTAGYAAAVSPSRALGIAVLVSLSYLIGLTYIAKQEAFDRVGALWPLLFLAAPIVYAAFVLPAGGTALVLAAAVLTAWIALAVSYLKRRAKGDVPRAVVSLIAGISLVDALFLAGAKRLDASIAAVACFLLTLALQRWVSGT
jgi:4-hydroxybenzoate polyprenyltransferase